LACFPISGNSSFLLADMLATVVEDLVVRFVVVVSGAGEECVFWFCLMLLLIGSFLYSLCCVEVFAVSVSVLLVVFIMVVVSLRSLSSRWCAQQGWVYMCGVSVVNVDVFFWRGMFFLHVNLCAIQRSQRSKYLCHGIQPC
jgi:hypothetical protein